MVICSSQHAFCLPCGEEAHGPCSCSDWQRWCVPYIHNIPPSSFLPLLFLLYSPQVHHCPLLYSFFTDRDLIHWGPTPSHTHTLTLIRSTRTHQSSPTPLSSACAWIVIVRYRQKKLADEMKAAGPMMGDSKVSRQTLLLSSRYLLPGLSCDLHLTWLCHNSLIFRPENIWPMLFGWLRTRRSALAALLP